MHPLDRVRLFPVRRHTALVAGRLRRSATSIAAVCATPRRSAAATIHLQADRTLTAEIVHRRLDCRRKRLYRLGTIARPLDDGQLREALRLLALQEACGREDFGEIFEG